MSRLKDDMLQQQEAFWAEATILLKQSKSFAEFFNRAYKVAPNFMKNSERSKCELDEELKEGWDEHWSKHCV
jgi:hypothetical protein|tara:strand:+ start:204 stop:419 length:216 start_codon:yes stop_codon:yes gene_type:complete